MLIVTVAPTTNDLTTITTAQREMDLDQADLDGVPELIAAASEIVAQHCGRLNAAKQSEFGAQTVVQTERGVSRDCIVLDRDLKPAITSVVEDGATLTAADYELDGSLLYRLSDDTRTAWCAEKVVITYTTGWTLLGGMPQPIEQATLKTLAALIAGRGENPMERRYDNGLVSILYRDAVGGMPPEAAQLLAPWRRLWL